jgi:CRP-like cAMP-binding protein/thioredoxin reductase
VVVGAGPAGLSAAARARAAGLGCVLLERAGHLADTVHCYQKGKPVMAEPSGVPLRSDVPFAAGRREEVLASWQAAARAQELPLRLGEEVRRVEALAASGGGARLRVHTAAGAYDADDVVLAVGTQGNRRGLGVAGEDLPHVSHRLVDAALHRGEEIVVVGAGDSALEVALALAAENAVHLVVRGPEIVRAKESLDREVRQLAARGRLTVHTSTVVERIEPQETVLAGPDGELRVAAGRVFLMLGAEPPRRFLEALGVRFSGAGRAARPALDGANGCREVPGIHLVGSVAGRGDLIKLAMNQGWEVVESILGRAVEPADEPVIAPRLPPGEGTVRERLARLREAVPLFAASEEADLREAFLSAETRDAADGEVLVRQNDYTNSVLVVLAGAVEVSITPEGQAGAERRVATLGPGRFFGEMGLISGQRRNATVRAAGPARLVEVPRRAMLKLMAVAPAVKRRVDETFLVRAFQTYLFPDVPRDSLERLVGEATVETRRRGEVVFEEGAEGDAFFVVRSGMVKVSQGRGERERVLSYLPAGNFFGEAALLPGSRRGATVTTIFPSELIRLGSDRFQAFVERNPELGPRLLAELEERRVASMAAAATPGFAEIQSRLIDEEIVMGTDVLLIDDHKCIRCGNCIAACEAVHDDGQARLTLTGIHFYNLLFPSSCWQCEDPLCMLDCPPDALVRDASGEIHVKSTCIGCGNCEANCPYGNIFLVHPREDQPFGFLRRLLGLGGREAEREVAVKCDMTGRPGGPACVLACPTGAAMRLSRAECEETLAEILVQRGDG